MCNNLILIDAYLITIANVTGTAFAGADRGSCTVLMVLRKSIFGRSTI